MSFQERHYIRHPTNIPLEFKVGSSTCACATKDVNAGGLCFTSEQCIDIGEHILITIPHCEPTFTANGLVKWCRCDGEGYLVGVVFEDEDVRYALRMVEQVCHIESYRDKLKQKRGIRLSSSQAAQRWIKKYAANFPSMVASS